MIGLDGNDTLLGRGGDDLFFESLMRWEPATTPDFTQSQIYSFCAGNDAIIGGVGRDVVSYDGTSIATIVELTAGTLTRKTERDSFSGIEELVLGSGDDRVSGSQTGLELDLGTGADVVLGLIRNGVVDGGGGKDLLKLSMMKTVMRVDMAQGQAGKGMAFAGFEFVTGSAMAAAWTKWCRAARGITC